MSMMNTCHVEIIRDCERSLETMRDWKLWETITDYEILYNYSHVCMYVYISIISVQRQESTGADPERGLNIEV